MIANEVVVEVENKPGQIAKIVRELKAGGVNLRAIATERFGTSGFVRFIPDDIDKVNEILSNGDYVFSVGSAVIKKFESLETIGDIAHKLGRNGVNINALYLSHSGVRPEVVFVLDNVKEGERIIDE